MGVMVESLLWVMQDFDHQPYLCDLRGRQHWPRLPDRMEDILCVGRPTKVFRAMNPKP